MFLPDDTPIIFKLPRDKEYADIYFIHDLHYGSELFDAKKCIKVENKVFLLILSLIL